MGDYMKRIVIKAFDRVLKDIDAENCSLEEVIDFVSYFVMELAHVLFNGNCVCRIGNDYAIDEMSLRKILKDEIRGKEEEIVIEIEPIRTEGHMGRDEVLSTMPPTLLSMIRRSS